MPYERAESSLAPSGLSFFTIGMASHAVPGLFSEESANSGPRPIISTFRDSELRRGHRELTECVFKTGAVEDQVVIPPRTEVPVPNSLPHHCPLTVRR